MAYQKLVHMEVQNEVTFISVRSILKDKIKNIDVKAQGWSKSILFHEYYKRKTVIHVFMYDSLYW